MIAVLWLNIVSSSRLTAGEMIQLTLDTAIDIAMKNSYSIKQLELGVEKNRYWLKAERAGLKSKVYMNLMAPELDAVSDYKWNSTMRKNEIIRQNTNRWQVDISIRQPLILLGYPTNGYLSLNNKIYRYLQKEDGDRDVDYYNRFFVRFQQPIFRPNQLKNDIENAELNLQREELYYIRNRVNLVNRVTFEFYDLFELIHKERVYQLTVQNLEKIYKSARTLALDDSTRKVEEVQALIELVNARELQMKNQSDLRLNMLNMKQRLRIDVHDSLSIKHDISLSNIPIDHADALEFGYTLRPHLQLLGIEKRRREITLNNAHGWDAFHLDFAVTAGLEKNHDRYQSMWEDYNNSYSVSINAYIPIWDWGRRKARINAEQVNVRRAELSIEENRSSLQNSINTALTNLEDYKRRALNLQESVKVVQEISDLSIQHYQDNTLSLQGVLQVFERQKETELNFLEAYLGYRRELQQLKGLTYYDFETDLSVIDMFKPEG